MYRTLHWNKTHYYYYYMLLEKSWIKSLAIFARFILELWCYKYFPFQDIDMLLVHCISKKRNVSMSQKKGSTYNIKALVKRKIIEICQCEKGFWVLQQKSHDFLPTFSFFSSRTLFPWGQKNIKHQHEICEIYSQDLVNLEWST